MINLKFRSILQGNRLQLQLYSDGCAMDPRNMVMHLEHVQAIITLTAPKRGDIEIYLTSPSGNQIRSLFYLLFESGIHVFLHFN